MVPMRPRHCFVLRPRPSVSGPLSTNCTVNLEFCEYNIAMVQLYNYDGDSFSGHRAEVQTNVTRSGETIGIPPSLNAFLKEMLAQGIG